MAKCAALTVLAVKELDCSENFVDVINVVRPYCSRATPAITHYMVPISICQCKIMRTYVQSKYLLKCVKTYHCQI